jgi:integrase
MGENERFSAPKSQNSHSGTLDKPKRRTAAYVPKYLTNDELARFFREVEKAGSKRDLALFRILYDHALRAHEPGKLELRDYDERAGRIFVRRGKGSNPGQYRLLTESKNALRAWIRERGKAPGALFLSRNHRPIGRRQLDRLMKRYCAAAGIAPDKAHCHALKHSRGTHLAEAGLDLLDIKDQLGHRKLDNTLIYINLSNARRDAVYEKLEGIRN